MKPPMLSINNSGVDLTAAQPAPFEKRNWTDETTLVLWKKIHTAERRKDEKTTMVNQKIYDEFKTAIPSSKRTKKAVEDKLQALREMYRFISDVNANRIAGSTGKPECFKLSKKEKKELRQRHRIKSPNLSQDVFEELDIFLGLQPDTEPLPSTFSAQSRFHEDDQFAGNADTVDTSNDVFGSATPKASSTCEGNDPHSTGRKNSKRKRSSKYDDMREILQEALFASTEKLQQEEMQERRKQHFEQMALIKELVMALTKSG